MAKDKAEARAEGRADDRPAGEPAPDGATALDRSVSHLLHRALQQALDVYVEEVGSGGLTQRQYAVLAAVEAREGLTQTELVRITGIDRSTLADMVQRMLAKGLLARERSAEDARANAVRLSDEGRAALDAARPKVEAADARLLKRLSSSKRAGFLSLLREIADAPPPGGRKKKKKTKAEKTAGEAKRKKKAKKAA